MLNVHVTSSCLYLQGKNLVFDLNHFKVKEVQFGLRKALLKHSHVASVTALMSLLCVGSGSLQDRIPVRLVEIMRKPPEHRTVAEVSLLHNMLSELEFYRRYSVTLQLLLARVVDRKSVV